MKHIINVIWHLLLGIRLHVLALFASSESDELSDDIVDLFFLVTIKIPWVFAMPLESF